MATNAGRVRKGETILPGWADEVPSEWGWYQLDDICLEIVDCPHSTPELVDQSSYLMARTSDILGGVFRSGEARCVSERTYRERTQRAEPRHGDLLYSREGTYFGVAAEIPPGTKVCLGQRMVLLRPDPRRVHPTYLRFWLNSPRIQAYIHGHRDGSVAERLNLPTIRRLPVATPSLPDQRAIAYILGTLDDKIELNRRMNETLEAMARALFKSWFVDFDPVRAKAAGRDPGLPKPLADLFPASFEDSELGEIPRGWSAGSILGQARLLSGGTPKTDRPDYWQGGIPWASAKDVSQAGQTFIVETERTITAKGLDESATQVVPSLSTVVVARGATTGRMALLGREMAMNQTCYALTSSVERPFALYLRLRHAIDALVHAAHGSVFDTITTSTFASSVVLQAPAPVLDSFERLVSPFYLRILACVAECVRLTEVRDALLPKLISGELRVENREKLAAAL
ncbi:MAG: restriction endonuclease subunit S [bacterium]